MDTNSPHNPSIVRAGRVVALQTPMELGGQSAPRNRIELQRDGDHISAIHVFCRCGEQIVLQCDLDDPRPLEAKAS